MHPLEILKSKGVNAQTKKEGNKEHCFSTLQTKTKGLGELEDKISLMLTSTIASPSLDINNQNQNQSQDQNNEEMVYVPHSPYYCSNSPTRCSMR